MERGYEYYIFEKVSDGSIVRRAFALGLDNACVKLHKLAKRSGNEFFAMHTPTKQIVAYANQQAGNL